MLKKYRKALAVTTLVLLVPMLAGVLLWNRLPEQLPTHFNAAGEADRFSSRAVAVFGIPGYLLALHWVCVLSTLYLDPKARNMESKMVGLLLWICPVVSLIATALVFSHGLGAALPTEMLMPLGLGLLMVLIGNWLPKCKPSYTLGIRLPWTLADEENWAATHRVAGPVWMFGGAAMMAAAFLGEAGVWLLLADVLAMAVVPAVYAFNHWRKKMKG